MSGPHEVIFWIAMALMFGGIALWIALDLMGIVGNFPKPSVKTQQLENERNRKK